MPKRKPGSPLPEEFAPEWAKIKPSSRMFGISDALLYELIGKGLVESFLLKSEPHAKMGVRLINIASLRSYFAAEAAKAAKAAKEPSPVAAKGREVMAVKRAAAKKEKETAAV